MGAVLIEGMKGCGKTSTTRQLAASEVLLDEWQRTPQLWDAVRRAVDDRGLTGQFILTGSATPKDDISIEANDSARLHPIADF